MSNESTEFLLHGFSDTPELKAFHVIVFLSIYLVAFMENLAIITFIFYNPQLHKPMYFFLVNLAFQDLGSISVTVPKSVLNALTDIKTISYAGCVCQVFVLLFFSASHFFLLGIMAFDRYTAICNPLHYESVMNMKVSFQMATGAWISGLVYSIVCTGNAFTMTFCSNDINQFFCEVPQLFKISCSDSNHSTFWVISVGASMSFIYLVLIIYSYVQIFRAVLRIPSTQGKQKAFSTCLPHLFVILLYFLSGSFAYLRPISRSPSITDFLISMLYCVVPPVMNPLIYSIRNKDIKMTFWKLKSNLCPSSYTIMTGQSVGNGLTFSKSHFK